VSVNNAVKFTIANIKYPCVWKWWLVQHRCGKRIQQVSPWRQSSNTYHGRKI